MKDVFISYKAEEREEANWVKSVLENNGISCWIAPACIPGGSNYAVEIPQAIRQVKVFVLILSSKAQSSRWVSREVDLAINEGKIVLPFMLENCALKDDFNFYLTNIQRYSAYENKVAAADKMIKEIKAILRSGEPEQPEKNVNIVNERIASKVTEEIAPHVKGKYDIKSVWSFIFGIVAMVLGVFLIPNIAALVLSILSLGSIKTNNTPGKELAISGQVLGLVSMATGLSLCFGGIGFVIALIIDTVSLVIFVKQYKK